MRFTLDDDVAAVVLEGDVEELEAFVESVAEAIETGEARGVLLNDDGVESVVIRRVSDAA